jgi:hypothetical protein
MNGAAALIALALAQAAPEGAPAEARPAAGEARPAEPSPAAAAETAEATAPAPVEETPAAAPSRPARRPAAAPATGTATATAAGATGKPDKAEGERREAARVALRFLGALLAGRSAEVASLCATTFSFDGRPVTGAEKVRARWGEILARRQGPPPALNDLELLTPAEAAARLGKPPRRLASLAGPGSYLALANLSGRPTLVFLGRQGGAWVATGLHD